MTARRPLPRRTRGRGLAAVEFALLLPVLLIALVDIARAAGADDPD
ncbi:hypothetical protein GTP38_14445 [Duganella sp. FT94W]|uniref:TadE-like domain-containing protein n=1 Tax=Duganella lactea TaxID=2692173 RepID=A0ABW9V9P2_9BURK|nr:TadE/TadG family type IV pilus assembly protein [Duganella lactea]MYM35532.1 hypothetical protein [Duganella lactea]